jgi:hypothetical protein
MDMRLVVSQRRFESGDEWKIPPADGNRIPAMKFTTESVQANDGFHVTSCDLEQNMAVPYWSVARGGFGGEV